MSTSSFNTGQKRPYTDATVPDEPCTPVKRVALDGRVPRTPSSMLTPEQRRKRMQGILEGLSSAPTTPSKHREDEGSRVSATLTGRTAGTQKPSNDRGPFYPASNDPFAGYSKQQANLAPASFLAATNTQSEVDSEEEFWTSSPPVARPPRGEFSAAGYLPGAQVKSLSARNAMPTPGPSSPIPGTRGCSQTSTSVVDGLLEGHQDADDISLVSDQDINFPHGSDNPFDVRASEEPADTPSSANPQEQSCNSKTIREHLAGLAGLPELIEKLERKHRAADLSVRKKQERIDELERKVQELEARVTELDKQCSAQEAVIGHLKTLIRPGSAM